jgi:filamentous hemagglutinin
LANSQAAANPYAAVLSPASSATSSANPNPTALTAAIITGRAGVGAVKWGVDNTAAGLSWEDYLATKLPAARLKPGFNTFDFWDENSGTAISAKVLNTNAPSYVQNPSSITSTIKGYVDDAAGFTKSRVGSTIFQDEEIVSKEIQLAVPSNISPTQLQQVAKAADYAAQQNIKLVVTEVDAYAGDIPP